MKSAEAWVAEIFLGPRSSHRYQNIVRQIQEEIREEAASLCHYESSAEEIAAAIRKIELP